LERAFDATIGTIVRLNGDHRFIRHVFQSYGENLGVALVLNALFLALARTESYAVNNMEQDQDELEQTFERLRQIFSDQIGVLTQQVLEPALGEEDA
jgi:hypothetical protein